MVMDAVEIRRTDHEDFDSWVDHRQTTMTKHENHPELASVGSSKEEVNEADNKLATCSYVAVVMT